MATKLNSQEILEKQFKRSMKGYNIDEVDSYLNVIIEDYEKFEKTVAELIEENNRLREQLESASRKPAQTPPVTNTTNFDILKRLSNLEKHVFGNKLDE